MAHNVQKMDQPNLVQTDNQTFNLKKKKFQGLFLFLFWSYITKPVMVISLCRFQLKLTALIKWEIELLMLIHANYLSELLIIWDLSI